MSIPGEVTSDGRGLSAYSKELVVRQNRPRRLGLESLEARRVLDSTVVINELFYHPTDDESTEWIELHNQMSVDMDLSGWYLAEGIHYTFLDGTVIAGGEYLVIAANPDALQAATGFADAVGPYSGRMSNGGETISLFNNSDRLMDQIDYSDSGDWPVGPDGSGSTLAKINRLSATAPSENWRTSDETGGTPGLENFVIEAVTRESLVVVDDGSAASVLVPADGGLGVDWTGKDFVEGAAGESWTAATTGIGFSVAAEVDSYSASILADNPIAYWRLDESPGATTAVNLGTAGTAAGGNYRAGVQLGQDSLVGDVLDSSLGITSADTSAAMNTAGFEKVAGGDGRTIEFWLALDGAPSSGALVGDGEGSTDFGHMVYLRSDGSLQIYLRSSTSGFFTTLVRTTRTLQAGEVVHVTSTWDTTTGEIATYLDGVPTATTTQGLGANPLNGSPVNTDNPVFIGRDTRSSGSPNVRIDEVAIYGKALDPERVAAHFSAGVPSFESSFATDIETLMHNVNASSYTRIPFMVPSNIAFDQLDMNVNYDDGFVAYLNGTEVARRNAPENLSFSVAATSDRETGDVLVEEQINLSSFAGLVQAGNNVLAIHGLNASAANNDFLLRPRLTASGDTILAGAGPQLAINEVSPATDVDFRVEIANDGETAVELAGMTLSTDNGSSYTFPATILPGGGLLAINEATLGFRPANNDKLFLKTTDGTALLDARNVTNSLRGRSPEHHGRWMYPDEATFGSANSFDFVADIVINEIMYHAQPQYATQSTESKTRLVSLNGDWRFDAPNDGLDGLNPAWNEPDFDDGAWDVGQASLGADNNQSDYTTTVLTDNPLAYWQLGEGNGPTVTDASGNGHDGVANAGVQFGTQGIVSGTDDAAIVTSGTNRVTVPGFDKVGSGFAVEFWINFQVIPSGFVNLVGDGEGGLDFNLMVYAGAGGFIRPHVQTNQGYSSIDSVESVEAGRTYHIVSTWDQASGAFKLYMDGIEAAVNVSAGIVPRMGSPINANNQLFLGQDNREPGGTFTLDEVALYDRALTPQEVAGHFAAGAGTSYTTPVDLGPTTHYFRREFEFEEDPNNAVLKLDTLIDDGAVFYLNGREVHRQNMPSGAITHSTLASSSVVTAMQVIDIPIPPTALVNGTNVLAVEVHQAAIDDGDVLFAAQLSLETAAGQNRPFVQSNEEWIELFNRGDSTIDLTNWQLDDAVRFDFPAGTIIAPGEYLLVARNARDLAEKYPGLSHQIAGSYSGTLSNHDDHILLIDAHRNLADEVTYYEGGKWPEFADGGGASLELRNPFADNAHGGAWSASREAAKSQWRSYAYRGIAANLPGANVPSNYSEFSFGLLDAGEVLIDDVSVIEDPDGSAIEFIQNPTFETGLTSWRPVGNQLGSVVSDPDDTNNQVFRLTATGPEEHLQNHVETTLKNGDTFESIQLGREYEISFRAKWLGGSPQLNTRLFFNLLPRTTILSTPSDNGTPGAQNSTFVPNIGPTYSALQHLPTTPSPEESITVSVSPSDPNGVASMTLMYSINGGDFASTTMSVADGGKYRGHIPGQTTDAIIQFYVVGTDSLGATSTFPAAGPDSRALLKVGQQTATSGLQNIQIIMTPTDGLFLGQSTNLMSNDRIGATVIYEGQVIYDAGVRLKGSEHGRPDPNRRGLSVAFPPDQLLRGVHDTVGIDRSGGWRFGTTFGQDEILVHQFFNRAGDIPSMFNDLVFVDSPAVTNSTAILQLARFTDTYLDSQYNNGGDGTRYEYELIYTMLASSGPESRKVASEAGGVRAVPVGDNFGDSKEAYRHNFLIKNNLDKDDYVPMMAMTAALAKGGDAFHEATQTVLDVDQWLRAFAALSLSGANDNFNNMGSGGWHNAQFYERPSDGKILLFPFDMDFAFILSPTIALSNNPVLDQLRTLPDNEHAFLGHLHDIMSTSFNTQYMADWVTHASALLPGQDLNSITSWIDQRHNFVQSQFPPLTDFELFGEPAKVTTTTILAEESAATVLIPSVDNGGDQLGTTWTDVGFVESADWQSGIAAVGYERTPADYAGLINLNVGDEMIDVNRTAFVRIPFEVTDDPAEFDNLKLRMKYDDGFVAYLNGVRIAEANAPANLPWDAGASAAHDDSEAVDFQEFDITDHIGELVVGQNVLAIHGLNELLTSSDFLISPEIVGEIVKQDQGGSDVIEVDTPAATVGGTGWINVKEIFVTGADSPLDVTWTATTGWQATIPVEFGTHDVTFQAFDFGGNLIGSDTVTITSTANNPLDGLRITEINYNPHGPTASELLAVPNVDDQDFEFIEVQNTGRQAIDLAGLRITNGVTFDFPDTTLASGEYAIVVRDATGFAARYPDGEINVLGAFAGGLRNSGEQLTIVDGGGAALVSVNYGDSGLWSEAPDGLGATLQLLDPAATSSAENSKHYSWTGSTRLGGTPGGPITAAPGVVINEILANTGDQSGLVDSIELLNISDAPIDIDGWFLSDSGNDLFKYDIPGGTVLAPGGRVTFDEFDFNPTPMKPGPNDFSLGGSGDDVWLVVPDAAGRVSRFVDEVHFGGTRAGESIGRVPDGSGGFAPLSRLGLGCSNSHPRVGPIVISELHYAPAEPAAAALAIDPDLTANDLEFIELHNPTTEDILLTDWRLRGGVSYDFSADLKLAAGETLLILTFDPLDSANAARTNAFLASFGIAANATFVGGYSGQLDNQGESVRLERPDPPTINNPDEVPYVTEDALTYDNLAPWPIAAAGTGTSLQRTLFTTGGNSASHWTGVSLSPGSISLGPGVTGDFDGDDMVTAADIDILLDAFHADSTVVPYDLNGSGDVTFADVEFLVENVLGTFMSDANLDRKVDAEDLNRVGINWQQTGGGCLTWSAGNFNGDDIVNSLDLNQLGIHWQAGVAAPAARVPRAPLALSVIVDRPTNPMKHQVPSRIDIPPTQDHQPTDRWFARSAVRARENAARRKSVTQHAPPSEMIHRHLVDALFAMDGDREQVIA